MHPRVLVLSPSTFSFENGTGVTLSNLFSGWPRERLACIHSSPQPPDMSVCGNFFRLSGEDIHRPWPFRGKAEGSSLGSAAPDSGAGALRAFWRSYIVGNSGLPQHFSPSNALNQWLLSFSPQVIYTVLGPLPHLEACLHLKQEFHAKLAVHFMDDWYAQAYTTGIFRFQRRRFLRVFHRLVEEADLHFTIGDRMSQVLSRRYGTKMQAFQNGIVVDQFRREIAALRRPFRPARDRQLLYFGSVLPFAQTEALALVAAAIASLNTRAGNLRLRIVTNRDCLADCRARLKDFSCVDIIPIDGSRDQFAAELAAADALVLPANFNSYSEEYLRYSMPTKLPGYMASGAPVLVFGPASIAQVLYAEENGWGLCVTSVKADALEAAIQKIMEDDDLRARLVAKAAETVALNHDLREVRARFQSELKSLMPG